MDSPTFKSKDIGTVETENNDSIHYGLFADISSSSDVSLSPFRKR